MSTPPPPDRPTEPLRPARRTPVVDERVVAPTVDSGVILLRLEDAIGSLRTGLMIVGLIAVAAMGVALYALLSDDSAGTRGGSRSGLASDERVSKLDDRIDRISRRLQSVRTSAGASDTTALSDRVDAIERTLRTLSSRPTNVDSTQAVEQLAGRVDTLASDLEQLKKAQPAP